MKETEIVKIWKRCMKIIRRIAGFITTVILVLLCIGIDAKYIEPNVIIEKRVSMKVQNNRIPLNIVFFTDTHFGRLYEQERIEEIVQKINKQKPDIVIFGGDFFDSYYQDASSLDVSYLMGELSKIDATYGKVAVWGNHDIGGAGAKIYAEVLHAGGFMILQNEQLYFKEINVVIRGLDDYLLGNPDLSMEVLPEGTTNIVVSHAPDIVDEMDLGNVDLVLSGHSHGGQVFVPGLTQKMLPPGAKKYKKGMYQLGGERDTKLFVSKGIGLTQIPFRFLNFPEIVLLELVE